MSKINVNNIEANDASTDITVTTGGSQSLLVDTNGKLTVAGNLSVNGNNYPSAGPLSNRNKILNGAMVLDQRNGGSSVTPTDGQYVLDRWRAGVSTASKFSVQQSSVAPAGFSFSTLCTSLSAYSVGTNDNFEVMQFIEGFNAADLAWGTSDAKTVTLSFWVRSSLTGTFGGTLNNSAFDRSFPFSYTISTANTWEYKTITVEGDTSGTWIGATNGTGVVVSIGLGAGTGRSDTAGSWYGSTLYNATGAVSLVGTNAATLYFTGVQLEQGDSATPFEHRSYGDELARCQRYFWKLATGVGIGSARKSDTESRLRFDFPTQMRASPTVTFTHSGSAGSGGDNEVSHVHSFELSHVGDSNNSWSLSAATADAEL